MDELLSTNLSALDPFDLIYLTDVTSEALGSRKEGWEIYAYFALQHDVIYSKEENQLINSSTTQLSSSTDFVPSIQAIWSKNLSLKHQIGLASSFRYRKEINGNSLRDQDNTFNSSANWLFTVTDRLLINASVSYHRFGRERSSNKILMSSSTIDYFIENNFSIYAEAQYM